MVCEVLYERNHTGNFDLWNVKISANSADSELDHKKLKTHKKPDVGNSQVQSGWVSIYSLIGAVA